MDRTNTAGGIGCLEYILDWSGMEVDESCDAINASKESFVNLVRSLLVEKHIKNRAEIEDGKYVLMGEAIEYADLIVKSMSIYEQYLKTEDSSKLSEWLDEIDAAHLLGLLLHVKYYFRQGSEKFIKETYIDIFDVDVAADVIKDIIIYAKSTQRPEFGDINDINEQVALVEFGFVTSKLDIASVFWLEIE